MVHEQVGLIKELVRSRFVCICGQLEQIQVQTISVLCAVYPMKALHTE
jgi:hypothetical protein